MRLVRVPIAPSNQVFQLSRETRIELCALALLGPVCCSDLRVDVAPVVFCTDASPRRRRHLFSRGVQDSSG